MALRLRHPSHQLIGSVGLAGCLNMIVVVLMVVEQLTLGQSQPSMLLFFHLIS